MRRIFFIWHSFLFLFYGITWIRRYENVDGMITLSQRGQAVAGIQHVFYYINLFLNIDSEFYLEIATNIYFELLLSYYIWYLSLFLRFQLMLFRAGQPQKHWFFPRIITYSHIIYRFPVHNCWQIKFFFALFS